MAHHNHLRSIEWILCGQGLHVINTCADVKQQARVSASRVANPAVLQVPYRDPLVTERPCQRASSGDVIHGQPATAMNEYDDRKRSVTFGDMEFAELQRVAAVGNLHARFA